MALGSMGSLAPAAQSCPTIDRRSHLTNRGARGSLGGFGGRLQLWAGWPAAPVRDLGADDHQLPGRGAVSDLSGHARQATGSEYPGSGSHPSPGA